MKIVIAESTISKLVSKFLDGYYVGTKKHKTKVAYRRGEIMFRAGGDAWFSFLPDSGFFTPSDEIYNALHSAFVLSNDVLKPIIKTWAENKFGLEIAKVMDARDWVNRLG